MKEINSNVKTIGLFLWTTLGMLCYGEKLFLHVIYSNFIASIVALIKWLGSLIWKFDIVSVDNFFGNVEMAISILKLRRDLWENVTKR